MLEDYATRHEIAFLSADEMLCEAILARCAAAAGGDENPHHLRQRVEWLRAFITLWEEAETASYV
jgi:hypothetical protein